MKTMKFFGIIVIIICAFAPPSAGLAVLVQAQNSKIFTNESGEKPSCQKGRCPKLTSLKKKKVLNKITALREKLKDGPSYTGLLNRPRAETREKFNYKAALE